MTAMDNMYSGSVSVSLEVLIIPPESTTIQTSALVPSDLSTTNTAARRLKLGGIALNFLPLTGVNATEQNQFITFQEQDYSIFTFQELSFSCRKQYNMIEIVVHIENNMSKIQFLTAQMENTGMFHTMRSTNQERPDFSVLCQFKNS